ncbi:MAG: EAL domain-containing protein [Negativicutes bacterium]|nr:EAL domain-containing protein [Negativicutes bacterium]
MVERYNSGDGSYAYLLDGSGAVVAHPDRKQVTELYNYKTMKKKVLLRDASGRIVKDNKNNEITEEIDLEVSPSLQTIVGKVMAGEKGGGEYTDLNGEQYVCAYRVIPLLGTDPWSLIVVQKKSAVLAFMDDVTIKTSLVGFLVLAFSVLLTLWFARRITNPLIELVHATDQIKNGDLNVRLDVKSSNEVGALAMNFNQMVFELRQHRGKLQELVAARTAQLGIANQEMEAMNEELSASNEMLGETNQRLKEENEVRQQVEENLLLRERQYRATTSLLTRPVDEIEELLESILRNAVLLLKAVSGYIGLYDESGKIFCIHQGIGIDESRIMERQSVEEGMQNHVYQTGELFYVEDYRTYSQRINDKRLERSSTVIMLPLKQEGKVIGILAVSWMDVIHPIRQEDVEVLRQFGDLASVALERANTQKKISYIAFHDSLTGLPNRASLTHYLEVEMEKAQVGEASGIVLFIDIDDLKSVNDNFGHSFGDNVIVTASKYIVDAVGEQAFVSRIGGDEFIVVLPGTNNREQAALIADKAIRKLCQEYEVSVERFHLSASIGVVVYPDDADTAEDVVMKADSAMYAAKKAGRNCWRFYKPIMIEEAYEKMMLTNGLRRALEREELFLHYQPQMSLEGDRVIGFEALLRWNSPEYGLVSPERFIPLAEQSGLILPIGQWVLQEVCQFARRLADMGQENIHVAANVSPRQLMSDDFVTTVRTSIKEAGVEPSQIELEITESVFIELMEENVVKLHKLREIGISLSLDDFGTGYSSLTYLRNLPVGILKIDKSFIDNIDQDEIQLQMVGSIINLGHTLGMTVVAEGVENDDQLKLLKQFNCDRIQGYIFSRPISEEDAIHFIR